MNSIMLRSAMFAAAALLTVLLPVVWGMETYGWLAVPFLILAEALLFLPQFKWRNKCFPLLLPLQLFVYPLYFVITLVLLCTVSYLGMKLLLTLELIAVFLLIVLTCTCFLSSKSGEK